MQTKLSKSDLINSTADKTGCARRLVKDVVDTLFNDIQEALVNGDIITIQGFGRFYTREAQGRSFKRINSEDIIVVGPRALPKTKFSKKLVERIKG